MFTDVYVTPRRLEVLLDTLRKFRGGLAPKMLQRLLQPEPLAPNGTPVAAATLSAARELQLVEDREGGKVSLTTKVRGQDSRTAILEAFDRCVLTSTEVESHFALFFSYVLGLGKAAHAKRRNLDVWVEEYRNRVHDGKPPKPFNDTALTGLHRWYDYVGLGWYDPADNFQPNPYVRLQRQLRAIFGRARNLDSEAFMTALAHQCPELDGGGVFKQANPHHEGATTKECTLGLSHALIELDLDGVLHISRPGDSSGWSIRAAEPQIEPTPDRAGTRISTVELLLD
jgi:hypothetical protein